MPIPLHLNKLISFSSNNGFLVQTLFTVNQTCCFIELVDLNSVHRILISVPDKYQLSNLNNSAIPVIEFQPYERNEPLTASLLAKQTYTLDSLALNTELPLRDQLNSVYDSHVILHNVQNEEALRFDALLEQWQRLSLCVKGMTYSIALLHAPFLLDSLEKSYKAETTLTFTEQRIYIVVDLETFYDKIKGVQTDCEQIVSGIETILVSNHRKHTKNMSLFVSRKASIIEQVSRIQPQNEEYIKYINEFIPLLQQLIETRQEKTNELEKLNRMVSVNIHHDMKRSHQKRVLEKEIEDMNVLQHKLISTIDDLRTKQQHLLLRVDKITFENLVLLDQLFRNTQELERLSKN